MAIQANHAADRRFGLLHAAATGAAVFVFLLVLLWASVASGAMPHLRALFGPMGAGSPAALLIGVGYAVVAGALTGLSLAIFHNLFGFLAPRRKADG